MEQEPIEFDYPEYHYQGMGCGLEDRGITDRYEAMRHGWDCALDRMAETIESYGHLYTTPQPSPTPAAPDVAGLLNRIVPRIDAGGPNPIDPALHCCEWTLHKERDRIHNEFADALATFHREG